MKAFAERSCQRGWGSPATSSFEAALRRAEDRAAKLVEAVVHEMVAYYDKRRANGKPKVDARFRERVAQLLERTPEHFGSADMDAGAARLADVWPRAARRRRRPFVGPLRLVRFTRLPRRGTRTPR